MTIRFYKTNEKFGEFSNFSNFPIVIQGMLWKTSEHFFQANKFLDTETYIKVMDAESPLIAASIGRNRSNKLRKDWELVKVSIMQTCVLEKFSQHKCLKELLLSTGEQIIIEASPYDYYWGEGADGTGKNMLGKILMETRDILRTKKVGTILEPWFYNSEYEPEDFFWSQGDAESVVINWLDFIDSMSAQEKINYLSENSLPKNWKDIVLSKINQNG